MIQYTYLVCKGREENIYSQSWIAQKYEQREKKEFIKNESVTRKYDMENNAYLST